MRRRISLCLGLSCLLVILGLVQGQDIDFTKARQLRQKVAKGEKLTDEEKVYLDKAQQAFQQKKNPKGEVKKQDLEPRPLTDMTAEDKYKGEDGGLYGGGRNEPPEPHLQAALQQAKLIQPLNADGKPAKDGKIVLISNGMSNTTQVFSQFVRVANGDPQKSSNVVVVDGAQGGMEAQAWAEPDKPFRPGQANPWDVLAQRLKQAGVTPEQVQVVWIKQARRNPASLGDYPKHADEMRGHMVVVLNKLKEKFPNLRIAYLSSRTYAGYATSGLNPEPYAYESAFVVRKLIRDQVKVSQP